MILANGVWILSALDLTMPGEPRWVEQQRAQDVGPVLYNALRWVNEGQQIRLEFVEQTLPEHPSVGEYREARAAEAGPDYTGPDGFEVGTRHDDQ